MKIAVIDSGIDKSHTRLNAAKITGHSIYKSPDNKYCISDDFHDDLGHGTACSSIIYKIAPSVEIVSLKIFHNDLTATEDLFEYALEYAINLGINIINLSLGIQTGSPSNRLYCLCEEAYQKNIVIIASAYHDVNKPCYPAYFPSVFGVASGKTTKKDEYGILTNSPIEFIARGTMQRVAWKNGGFTIVSGNSYACAYFAGIVANTIIKSSIVKSRDIKELLIHNANPNITVIGGVTKNNYAIPFIKRNDLDQIGLEIFNSKNKLKWLNKIALFPICEKELKIFLEFPDHVKYKVALHLDYPRNLSSKILESQASTFINRYPTEEEYDSVNSLIIGYFYEHLFEANVNFGLNILTESMKRGKNIYFYDTKLINIINKIDKIASEAKTYIPVIDNNIFNKVMSFQYLEKVKVPVIMVIGTSNKQGKFTTQLRVKEILEREGYKISHISTEPQGELFGADFSFPYGYNSLVLINRNIWAIFLRVLTRAIQEYNKPHLILTGTQSSTIPRSPFVLNPLGNETETLDFISGIQPDGLICSINPNDSVDLIKKNIETAITYSGAKILFLTMTPLQRNFEKNRNNLFNKGYFLLANDEKNERLEFFSKILGYPVIDIKDKTNDHFILNKIQETFS